MNTLDSVILKLRSEEQATRRKWLSVRRALKACRAIDRTSSRGQAHSAESRRKISLSQRRRWAARKRAAQV